MSWTRTLASGSGQLAWRVEIEGYPSCLVSHASMVQTDGDGRTWLLGLKSDGWKFGQKVDLVTAKAEGTSLRVKFANRSAGAALFAKRPTAVTYLASDLTAASTTAITVKSSDAFPASGKLYINTETIAYTAKSLSTTFNTLTRGVWKTLAQAHYTTDGDRLRYPEVTDWPVVLEGRRVRFYVYGAGDSKTGNGTLAWTGVASTDVAFNGAEWTFQVDSLFRVLDQEVGSDLEDPSPIRGIYYPASAPLVLRFKERSGADGPGSGSPDSDANTGGIALAGFWESQAAFIVALQTAIDAELTAEGFTSTDVTVVEDGEQWAIQFTTASVSPLFMDFSGVDSGGGALSPVDYIAGPFSAEAPDGRLVSTVAASSVYVYRQTSRTLGTVPRAIYGYWSPAVAALSAGDLTETDVDESTFPAYRIYLGGAAGVTSATTSALVDWQSSSIGEPRSGTFAVTVNAIDASSRYITTARPPASGTDVGFFAWASGDSAPSVRMGRDYGSGTLADFVSNTAPGLAGQTATYLNTGAVPDIRPTTYGVTGDFSATQTDAAAAGAETVFSARRGFTAFASVSLRECIEHECRLLGVFPVIENAASIVFKRLALPAPSEVGSSTITASIVITDDQILSWERAAIGIYNTVRYRTGYDPIESEHRGATYVVRDVAAYGQSPVSRVLEVAPVSQDPSTPTIFSDLVQLAGRVLGVFGGPYVYLTIEVPLTYWGTVPGDVIAVTWSKVPESDGTLGVTSKIGLVVAAEFEPMAARGQLTVMLTDQRIAGYVPGGKITVISGASGGTSFTLTVPTDYRPSGVTGADVWTAGDLIRLFEWGTTTTADNALGTVVSATGTSLVITTSAAWNHTGKTWAVGGRVSTEITAASQKLYCYVARSDGTVDWSGDTDNPAFTFAP